MHKRPYGIGIIGTGVIWRNKHCGALESMDDDVQVRYVYDIDPRLAQEAAETTGAKAVDSAEEIFQAKDVDIVAVLTPPFARVNYVKKASEAGKHLMLEKPMARTLEDGLEIHHAVKDSGIKCFQSFARAHDASYREVVRFIRSGALGEPVVFTHRFLGGPYGWIPLDHWMHDQEKSGGPVFDFSIHFIDFARACMGAEADLVVYAGRNTTGRLKSDDHATLLIYYHGKGFGEFTRSWAFPPKIRCREPISTHIICRNGVLMMDWDGATLCTQDGQRRMEMPDKGGHAASYRNLISAIEDDAPLFADTMDGLRSLEILDAALKSRESGKREKVVLHQ